MFCPKCGTQLEDNAAFCAHCGAAVHETDSRSDRFNHPVSKRTYFAKIAPKSHLLMRYVALVLGLACILIVFLSANTTVNGSIFEHPLVSTLIGEEGEEMQRELNQALDEYEKYSEMGEIGEFLEETLDAKIDETMVSADAVIDLLRPVSIGNLVKLGELFGVEDSDVVQGLNIFVTIVWVLAIVLMGLTALGVLFQKAWLMVLSLILGAIFIVITGGVGYLVLAAITYIATAVLFSKMKREYKAYKRSCKRA